MAIGVIRVLAAAVLLGERNEFVEVLVEAPRRARRYLELTFTGRCAHRRACRDWLAVVRAEPAPGTSCARWSRAIDLPSASACATVTAAPSTSAASRDSTAEQGPPGSLRVPAYRPSARRTGAATPRPRAATGDDLRLGLQLFEQPAGLVRELEPIRLTRREHAGDIVRDPRDALAARRLAKLR